MIFGWTAWPILFDERLQKLCILSLVLPRQHGELRQYSVPHRVEPAALIPAIGFRRIRGHLSGIYALAKSRFHHGSGARFHIVPLPFFPQIIVGIGVDRHEVYSKIMAGLWHRPRKAADGHRVASGSTTASVSGADRSGSAPLQKGSRRALKLDFFDYPDPPGGSLGESPAPGQLGTARRARALCCARD